MAEKIDDWRFIPSLQLHEFEALVMAHLPALEDLYDAQDQLAGLAMLQAEVAVLQPEEINEPPSTAPSKRLLQHIPGYSKINDGPTAIKEAGLQHVRQRCPRFDAWLSGLEGLASGAGG